MLKATAERMTLHVNAANALASIGHNEDAIVHYMAAEQWNDAADLVEMVGYSRMLSLKDVLLTSWLEELPKSVINERPKLLLIKAWSFFGLTDIRPVAEYLDLIDVLVEDSSTALTDDEREQIRSHVILYRMQLARIYGDQRAIAHWESRISENIKKKGAELDSVALMSVSLETLANGDMREVLRVGKIALEKAKDEGNYFVAMSVSLLMAITLYYSGNVPKAFESCEAIVRWLDEQGQDPTFTQGWQNMVMLEIYREVNELEKARACWEKLQDFMAYVSEPGQGGMISVFYANVLIAMKDYEAAKQLLDQSENIFKNNLSHWSYMSPPISLIRARIALFENDLDTVKTMVSNETLPSKLHASHIDDEEHLLLVRYYIMCGDYHEALESLTPILQAAYQMGRVHSHTRALIYDAVIKYKLAEIKPAHTALERAITQARESGFLRVVLDEMDVLDGIIQNLECKDTGNQNYLQQLLKMAAAENSIEHRAAVSSVSSNLARQLRDSLTPREIEVLHLIERGLRNNEIADHLSIATTTAKAHVRNLYEKLEVNSRTQAVVRAREIGVL
jgi:LuxR family maltose regulon positive regulatory protein